MKDDCSAYTKKLSVYMDGQLSPDETAHVAAHLETCESCSLLLEKMRRVDEMAEHIMPEFDETLMTRLADRISAGIDESGQSAGDAEASRMKAIPIWYRYVAVAASVAIVFLAGRMALKESGGDLLRPAVSFDAPKATPADIVIDLDERAAESVHEDKSVIPGTEDVERGRDLEVAAKREKRGGQKGEPVPEESLLIEERVEGRVIPEQAQPPAEEKSDRPQTAVDDAEPISPFAQIDRSGAGPSGKIRGRIIDAATGKPLPGVSVQVQGTNIGAMSDNDGEFDIQGVPPDTYDLISSSPGYRVMRFQAPADTGQVIARTIPMEPALVEAGTVAEVIAGESADADTDWAAKLEVEESETAIICLIDGCAPGERRGRGYTVKNRLFCRRRTGRRAGAGPAAFR